MFRVRTTFTGLQGSPWLSTMYFDSSTGTVADCVNAVAGWWSDVDAAMSNLVDWATLPDVETVDAATGNVTAVTSTGVISSTGGLAAEPAPTVSQGLMRWRTGVYVAGREIRGRTFIPGLTVAASDDGRLTSALQTLLNTAAADFIAFPGVSPVVWSRKNGTQSPISSGSVWSEFAALRSRRD